MAFLTEDSFDHFLNGRHTGHTADQDHFADVIFGEAGIFQSL